ncbi:MAG: hypothetical protein HYX84_01930 [Chloroflexi bacterium]|nr:hypothetical protein [Chloroflexota bacterium]
MQRPFPQHALRRGSVHASLGMAISIALSQYGREMIVIPLAAATLVTLSVEAARLHNPVLNRWFMTGLRPVVRAEEENRFSGGSFFLIGSLVSAIVFPPEIAIPAIVFLAVGDPVAGVIGTWIGRVRLWKKTVEGGIACLIVCLAAVAVITAIAARPSLGVMLIGAVSATVFQALPVRINDNLTIPIGSALVMALAGIVL